MYEASNGDMPWNPKEKYAELFHSTSRMFLVHKITTTGESKQDQLMEETSNGAAVEEMNEKGEFVGFTHFRFEEDDEGDDILLSLAIICSLRTPTQYYLPSSPICFVLTCSLNIFVTSILFCSNIYIYMLCCRLYPMSLYIFP